MRNNTITKENKPKILKIFLELDFLPALFHPRLPHILVILKFRTILTAKK